MMIITEIESNQEKDHENVIIRAVESDGKIKSLHEENYKMAAEIESLKATVTIGCPLISTNLHKN